LRPMSDDRLRTPHAKADEPRHFQGPVLDRSESIGMSGRGTRRVWNITDRANGMGGFLKANLAVLVVLLIISASVVFAVSSIPARTESYSIRGPILIESDTEFTSENGVVSGSGAPADPYVISGWHIIVDSGIGIHVHDTTAHFMILDVWINGTASPSGSITGILLFYLSYGQVKNCLINDTNTAVDIQWGYDSSVYGNEFLGTKGFAVSIQNSNRVHIVDNYFQGQNGILASNWQQSNVMLNEFLANEMCLSGSDINGLAVKENTAVQCGYPVSLSWSTNLQVHNNVFTNCMYGIDLQHTTYADIRGNVVEQATSSGISIWGSSYTFTVCDNIVNGTQTYGGVFIENSWDMEVSNNLISNNSISVGSLGGGVTLYTGCHDILVCNNSFVDNTPHQAHDSNVMTDLWNETYPLGGNYWSDYAGDDLMQGPGQDVPGSDGYGDTPFQVDVDTLSYYPLMAPVPATIRPVADFTVDPLVGDNVTAVAFDGSSSSHPDPKKSITGYRWDFDCDGRFDTSWSSDPVIAHLFPVPGNYTVILEVEDGDGMTDLTTRVVTILDESIIPEFGAAGVPVLALMVLVAAAFRRRNGTG